MQLSAVWGKADTLQGVQQGTGRTQGLASAGWAAAAARPLPSVPEPARHRHALLSPVTPGSRWAGKHSAGQR